MGCTSLGSSAHKEAQFNTPTGVLDLDFCAEWDQIHLFFLFEQMNEKKTFAIKAQSRHRNL